MKSIINAIIIAVIGVTLSTGCTTTSKAPHPDTQFVHTMDVVTGQWTRGRSIDREDVRKRENLDRAATVASVAWLPFYGFGMAFYGAAADAASSGSGGVSPNPSSISINPGAVAVNP